MSSASGVISRRSVGWAGSISIRVHHSRETVLRKYKSGWFFVAMDGRRPFIQKAHKAVRPMKRVVRAKTTAKRETQQDVTNGGEKGVKSALRMQEMDWESCLGGQFLV